jgi:hypothetical protein
MPVQGSIHRALAYQGFVLPSKTCGFARVLEVFDAGFQSVRKLVITVWGIAFGDLFWFWGLVMVLVLGVLVWYGFWFGYWFLSFAARLG